MSKYIDEISIKIGQQEHRILFDVRLLYSRLIRLAETNEECSVYY